MNRIETLDGLRGLAALWVLIGHCMLLTGFLVPVLGNPELGVDLFILLSGFLMVFQYNLRKDHEDWGQSKVWVTFWIRRFFRLSPLYFTLLAVALVAGPMIYADRLLIDGALHNVPQLAERYTDGSLTNVLMHVSYLFGLFPAYAFHTPLPDWSLGLEMQFYAVFPFLILLVRRIDWVPAAILIALVGIALAFAAKKAGLDYPMPSFLPLKIQMFLAGMLVAAATDRPKPLFFVMVVLLTAIPIGGAHGLLHSVVRELLAVGFFALIHWRHITVIGAAAKVMGSAPCHWLGELSYGVYLVHLLVLHRAAAWAITHWGSSPAVRFALVVSIVAAVSYSVAYATYRLVELPGQTLGKRILGAMKKRRQPVLTGA